MVGGANAINRAQPSGCDQERDGSLLVDDTEEGDVDHQLLDVYEGDQDERAAKRQEQVQSRKQERY
jgi:hypothetical protein